MANSKKNKILGYVVEHKFKIGFYTLLLGWFVLFITVLGDVNLLTWIKARSDIRAQHALMEKYRYQIDSLNNEIATLTNNRDSLERFARENFKYAASDEDVFVISDSLIE